MAFLLGFAPWIVFWFIAGQNGNQETLLIASLLGLGISIVAIFVQHKNIGVSSLDIGSIIFFAGFAIAVPFVSDQWLDTYNQFLSTGALFIIVVAGVLAGHPFTLVYARASVPQVMWDAPHFIESNTKITRVWAMTFAVMTISSGVLFFVPDSDTNQLIFVWIIPFCAFGLTIVWQFHYIATRQRMGREYQQEQMAKPIHVGEGIVTAVDHVTTVLAEQDATKLAQILTNELKLMTAWKFADFGLMKSGGWRMGNVNLEVIGLDPEKNPGMPERFVTLSPTSLTGLDEELTRRQIAHSEPMPQEDGHGKILYTRVELLGMGDEQDRSKLVAQLCAYAFPTATSATVAPPNPAGIINVAEVEVGAKTMDQAQNRWSRLFDPITLDGSSFHPSSGPALRVTPASEDAVTGLAINVANVKDAIKAINKAGLATEGSTVWLGTLKATLIA